jgi:hypothetical protein
MNEKTIPSTREWAINNYNIISGFRPETKYKEMIKKSLILMILKFLIWRNKED